MEVQQNFWKSGPLFGPASVDINNNSGNGSLAQCCFANDNDNNRENNFRVEKDPIFPINEVHNISQLSAELNIIMGLKDESKSGILYPPFGSLRSDCNVSEADIISNMETSSRFSNQIETGNLCEMHKVIRKPERVCVESCKCVETEWPQSRPYTLFPQNTVNQPINQEKKSCGTGRMSDGSSVSQSGSFDNMVSRIVDDELDEKCLNGLMNKSSLLSGTTNGYTSSDIERIWSSKSNDCSLASVNHFYAPPTTRSSAVPSGFGRDALPMSGTTSSFLPKHSSVPDNLSACSHDDWSWSDSKPSGVFNDQPSTTRRTDPVKEVSRFGFCLEPKEPEVEERKESNLLGLLRDMDDDILKSFLTSLASDKKNWTPEMGLEDYLAWHNGSNDNLFGNNNNNIAAAKMLNDESTRAVPFNRMPPNFPPPVRPMQEMHGMAGYPGQTSAAIRATQDITGLNMPGHMDMLPLLNPAGVTSDCGMGMAKLAVGSQFNALGRSMTPNTAHPIPAMIQPASAHRAFILPGQYPFISEQTKLRPPPPALSPFAIDVLPPHAFIPKYPAPVMGAGRFHLVSTRCYDPMMRGGEDNYQLPLPQPFHPEANIETRPSTESKRVEQPAAGLKSGALWKLSESEWDHMVSGAGDGLWGGGKGSGIVYPPGKMEGGDDGRIGQQMFNGSKFLHDNKAQRRIGAANEMLIYLEACCEQLRLLESEEKQIEVEVNGKQKQMYGRMFSMLGSSTLVVPRLPHNPSRVDHLVVESLREHAKVTCTLNRLKWMRSEPLHANIFSAMERWMEGIRKVQARRKEEIVSTANRSNGITPRPQNDKDILALSSSISELHGQTRRVRTALWCAYQAALYQNIIPTNTASNTASA